MCRVSAQKCFGFFFFFRFQPNCIPLEMAKKKKNTETHSHSNDSLFKISVLVVACLEQWRGQISPMGFYGDMKRKHLNATFLILC